jgi:hypothetical protein
MPTKINKNRRTSFIFAQMNAARCIHLSKDKRNIEGITNRNNFAFAHPATSCYL